MFAEASTLPMGTILDQVSWYWYTKSYGRTLWAYRGVWQAFLRDKANGLPSPLVITKKPLGYSYYPNELLTVPKSWAEHYFPDNLVLFSVHEKVSSSVF